MKKLISIMLFGLIFVSACVQEGQNTITTEDLNKGCYFGDYNQKIPGTPDDWTWHEAGRSSYWSAPNKTLEDC